MEEKKIQESASICEQTNETNEVTAQSEIGEQLTVLDSDKKNKLGKKNIITVVVSVILLIAIALCILICVKHHNDVKAAENVVVMIDELGEPNVVGSFPDKMKAVQESYEALTDRQKKYVTNKETFDEVYDKYSTKLRLSFFIPSIKANAALCQAFFSDYASVWHNAIYRNTDEYNNGDFSDFNTALLNFQLSDTYVSAQKKLTEEHESIKNTWGTLDGVNTLDAEAYQAIKKLYITYQSMYELATNPAGSYNSYTEETKNLNSDYKANYAEVVAVIPEATVWDL